MRITVKLGDPLWRKVGTRRLELDLDESKATVAHALARLGALYPEAMADVLPNGKSATERLPYHVFVNSRKVPWNQLDHVPLQDGDQLILFLIVVGG